MKDKFINAALFYEQIGGKLESAMDDIRRVNKFGKELYETPWFPEDMKARCNTYIRWSYDAWHAMDEIKNMFEQNKAVRKEVNVIPERKRIERMTVILGGLYEPQKVGGDDDILSDNFKAWQQEQSAKEDHENA